MSALPTLFALALLAWNERPLLERWTTLDGLPQNTVSALAIAPDRSLWLATFGGVARFDGEGFEVLTKAHYPELPSDRTTALVVGRDGTVWVGTQGGGVARFLHGECRALPSDERLEQVVTLRLDPSGGVWVCAAGGLFRIEDERFASVGLEGCSVRDVRFLPGGAAFAATQRGVYRIGAGEPELVLEGDCARVAPLDDGSVLASTGEGGLLRRDPDGTIVTLAVDEPVQCLAPDGAGDAWIGTESHLLHAEGLAAATDWSEPMLGIHEILVDEEGTWIGGHGTGLWRLSQSPMRGWKPDDMAKVSMVIAEDERTVLVGTLSARDVLQPPLRIDLLEGTLAGTDLPGVFCAGPARRGVLLGTPAGIVRLERGELTDRWDWSEPGEYGMPLLEDRQGNLWTTSPDGRVRRRRNGEERLFGGEDGLIATTTPHDLLEDSTQPAGRIWIASEAGLSCIEGDRVRSWRAGHELPAAAVRALCEGPDGSLWGGTYGGGLFRLTGERVDRVSTDQGLREDFVTHLGAAGEDDLVLVGNRGLSRVRWEDLQAVADGEREWLQAEEYRIAPDMEYIEGNSWKPATARTADGSLWFVTIGGVLSFDPAHAPRTAPVTRARIDRVLLDGQRQGRGPLEMPSRGHRVTFDFSAATLVDPVRVPLRYRLRGGDDESWVEARGRRSVTLARLAPGSYTFEVAVSGARAQPTGYSFEVLPALTETLLFRLLTGVGVLGLLGLLLASQRRRAARRSQTLEQKVAERTRELATEVEVRLQMETRLRESHDTLEERVQARTEELAEALRQLHDDVERRKELEQKLLEAQKLESVGRLAGGVAHDFNNLLTVILGTAEDVQARASERPGQRPLAEDMETILDAGNRGADLIRRLLAFARKQPVAPRQIDLREELEELQPLLERLLGHKADLELALGDGAFPAILDPVHLEQIVLNLVANAGDAIPSGGSVRLELSRADDDSETYLLRVSDDGPGIPAEIRDKIFEPFFTTKAAGKGTGLGLSTCYGLASSMGGSIDVESGPEGGTTVVVRLPALTLEREGEDAPLRQRVLLVDDDPAVLMIVRKTLERAGWKVRAAGSAAEALDACDSEPFDVVLSDVTMPQKSGAELARELALLHPELPVVLMTGHVPENVALLMGIGTVLIHKPIEADELFAALRRASRRGRERAAGAASS